jgi:hypothetical protein
MSDEADLLISEAAQARQRVLELAASFSPAQGIFRPGPEAWSAAEVLEHLVIAEQGSINRLWLAAERLHRGQPAFEGEHVLRGLTLEEAVERTWAPQEQAPDFSRPRLRGPLAYWTAALTCNQPLLDRLAPVLAGLDLAQVITPHPISGPLDARQWLGFLRFHLDRHRGQIQAIAQAPGFPA